VAAIQGEATVLSVTLSPTGTAGSIPGIDALEDLVHAGLGNFNNAGELWPQLAERVPSVENELWRVYPDGRMETTWRLRENALWQDGTPLTADDLLFTVQVAREKRVRAFTSPPWDLVESALAPDPRTITLIWSAPFIEADTLFSHLPARGSPLPRHLLEAPYSENPDSFTELPYWNLAYVGAGPFKVEELVLGSHLLVTAFDRYVLGRPQVDSIEVRFIPDINVITTNLLAGTVETALGTRTGLDTTLYLRDQWRHGTVEIGDRGSSWLAIYPQFIDPRPAVQLDVRFRRALVHALDRQEMADTLLAGLVPVAHTIIRPSDPDFAAVQSSAIRYEYDPNRTAQMMAELAYARGQDGMLRDGAGQSLSVEVWATDQTTIQPKALLSVADYWRRAGVGAETNVVPNQRVADREYRNTRPAFEVLSNSNTFAGFHSAQVPLTQNAFVGNNRSRYASSELDALIDQYFRTIPRLERTQTLGQIVRHLTEHVVVVGISYSVNHGYIGRRLVNVGARGEKWTEAWNAHEWDIRVGETS
jgi:peptide/nickel transport system substrate-binding protein